MESGFVLGDPEVKLSSTETSKKLGSKMTALAWVPGLGRQNCLTQRINMSLRINPSRKNM